MKYVRDQLLDGIASKSSIATLLAKSEVDFLDKPPK